VPMGGSGEQSAKDEQVKRALQQLHTGRGISTHRAGILLFLCRVSTSDRDTNCQQFWQTIVSDRSESKLGERKAQQ
jgi:hypothetical protein